MMKTPVLLLVFNRPKMTEKVFKTVREVKPEKLFIAADGPRDNIEGEKENVERVRSIVTNVDWDCEVKTLFREKNLGLMKAVSGALDWFFEHVEQGIILEDDCVPNDSFYHFCSAMLDRYKDDERIMVVSGTNYLYGEKPVAESYFFSRYYAIWGWATWRRAWQLIDLDMKDWPKHRDEFLLDHIYNDPNITKYYQGFFEDAAAKKVDSWAIPWALTLMTNHALAVVPVANLVSNIGADGTHFENEDGSHVLNMAIRDIDVQNLIHPQTVGPNYRVDKIAFKNLLKKKPKPLKKALNRFLYKIGLCGQTQAKVLE